MRRLFNFLFVSLFIFTSCSSDEDIISRGNNNEEMLESMTFSYRGIEYNSTYTLNEEGDSTIITFSDLNVGKLYHELNNLPNIAQYIEDERVFYFDNEEEMINYLGIQQGNEEEMSTRGVPPPHLWNIVTFYKDKNYKGRSLTTSITQDVPRISSLDSKLNDEISSFKVDLIFNPTQSNNRHYLLIYKDTYYSGSSRLFEIKGYTYSVPRLAFYGMNDNISSYRWLQVPR